MKGQINLEFLTATFVYLLAVGAVLVTVTQVSPDLRDDAEQKGLNLEVKQVSDRLLSREGSYSGGTDWQNAESDGIEEIGLSDGNYHSIHPEKLDKLQSFTMSAGSDKVNYSVFRSLMGVQSQVALNFTKKPVVRFEREIPVSGYENGSVDDMLEGYWRFDHETGDVRDYSGHDRDASIQGSVERGMEGALGTASFEFSGGMVEADHDFEPSDEITISTWVKPRDFSEGWIVGVADGEERFGLRMNSGSIELVQNTTGTLDVIYSENLPRNRFVHAAAVRTNDGENRLFVDGYSVGEGENTIEPSVSGNLVIGDTQGGEEFEGKIDEVRYYEQPIVESGIERLKSGLDQYSKPGGVPVIIPEDLNATSEVRYGRSILNGSEAHFLVELRDGNFQNLFVNNNYNFSEEEALKQGDSFEMEQRNYTVDYIGSEGRVTVLSDHLKFFGPQPDPSQNTVKLNRYGLMNEKVVEIEVFGW